MTIQKTLGVLAVLVVLAVIFGFWASHTTPPTLTGTQTQTQTQADPLGGTATTSGDMEYAEDTDVYTIDIVYPPVLAVEQGLAQTVAQFKQDGNFANLTPQDIAYQNITPDHKYALDATYKKYQSSQTGTVSYVFTEYEDTLGAHPNGFYQTFVFDQTGTQVQISDLFDPASNWLQDLSTLVTNDVTAQMQQRLGQSDVSSALFPDGLAADENNFANFAVDGDTLVIEIPPYQVAAYAAGSFEVRIPLADLNH